MLTMLDQAWFPRRARTQVRGKDHKISIWGLRSVTSQSNKTHESMGSRRFLSNRSIGIRSHMMMTSFNTHNSTSHNEQTHVTNLFIE